MKNDLEIDWLAISQQGASNRAVDRLQRVINFFDQLNVTAKSEQPDKYWCDLEVHEPIASGSFGTLYRAYDPHLRREVALKLLAQDTPGASDWLEEARRLARVRHPGVIAILGASSDDRHAGIWMELSNGESLESLLTSSGIYPLNQTLETGIAIAEALEAVHERGLVHGDLKAGNVLIEPSGRVLLLDFGAATAHGEPANQASPRTAAPEQLAGQKADPAADIWSLGVLLYRCLSGQQPYRATDMDALVTAQQRAPELGTVSRPFRSLISEMLSFDPTQRPNAEQVADELRWIGSAPTRRRKNLALGGIAASLLIGITVASIGWYNALQANQREQQATVAAETARDEAQRWAEEAESSLQFFQDVVGASFEGTHGQDARIIDVLEQSQRQLALDDSQPPYVRAMVQFVVGASYLDLGRADEGMALLDESQALLAGDDVDVPQSEALILVEQGMQWCELDADRAEQAAARLRTIAEGRLPPEHRAFLGALVIESCAAQRRGDEALAEQQLRAALALRPLADFPADISAITIAGRLGSLLVSTGRLTEAVPLLEDVRTRAVALLGPSNNSSLGAAASLGEAYMQSSRFDEAVALLEETLSEVEARRGDTSRQWIMTATAFATALAGAGEAVRSLEMLEQIMNVATEQLGATHDFTLAIRTNRANRLVQLGRLDEGEVAMAENGDLIESELGAGHQLAIMNRMNRIEVLMMLNRVSEAVPLGRRTLESSLESLGPDHGLTAGIQGYLANALAVNGEVEEAEQLFIQALAFHDRNNPGSDAAHEVRYRLASLMADQGRISEVRQALVALEPAFDSFPPGHPLLEQIAALKERVSP